jgi:NAD(P)H-flavin reductase
LRNILIEGPQGECIFLKDEKKCTFICAGTGYAQIRPMLLELLSKPCHGKNDTLIILVSSERDIYDSDFINHLNEIGLINTYIVLSNGSCERFQYLRSLPSALKRTVLPMDNVYISGSKGLSVDVSKIIRSNGHIGKINSDSL